MATRAESTARDLSASARGAAPEIDELIWPHPLRGFQIAGIERLLGKPCVLLADEMGLGKTIQVIAALRILHRRGALGGAALILLPAGLILQWQRQLWQWAPELRLSTVIGLADDRPERWRASADVYLASYDSLRADGGLRGPWAPFTRQWDVVIADEAQRLKNPKAQIAVAVKRLNRARSWALTGTPLENTIADLLSVLDFAAPGRYVPGTMMAGLRRTLAEVQLRRRRAEMLPDLPPKTGQVIDIELGRNQRAAYDKAHREGIVWLRGLGRELMISHILELILRLKQICNVCPETGESAKFDDMSRRLETLARSGEKALIFSQFTAAPFGVHALAERLSALKPVVLTGGINMTVRDQRIRNFERDPERRVMLLSLMAGGLGLNLTSASCVFHFDRWWNPAVENQAEDRAHRMGQTRPVQVFAYQTADTIEERVAEILAEKRAIFTDIVDGVDASQLRKLDQRTLLAAIGVSIR
jgi:SNF2 family DNA or RNA helicase